MRSKTMMVLFATSRPLLSALAVNLLFLLWAWRGVNHGKGIFYFTTDELGLMLFMPLPVIGNAVLWLAFYGLNQPALMRAFGYLLLLLLGGCAAVWAHGYANGVTA